MTNYHSCFSASPQLLVFWKRDGKIPVDSTVNNFALRARANYPPPNRESGRWQKLGWLPISRSRFAFFVWPSAQIERQRKLREFLGTSLANEYTKAKILTFELDDALVFPISASFFSRRIIKCLRYMRTEIILLLPFVPILRLGQSIRSESKPINLWRKLDHMINSFSKPGNRTFHDFGVKKGVGGIISKNRDESSRKHHEESFRKLKTGQWGIISKFKPTWQQCIMWGTKLIEVNKYNVLKLTAIA